MAEGSGVNEEGRHKIHGVATAQVGVLCELRPPAIYNRALAERARLAGEARGEDLVPVLELVGMSGVVSNVASQRHGVVSCGTGEDTSMACQWLGQTVLNAHVMKLLTSCQMR